MCTWFVLAIKKEESEKNRLPCSQVPFNRTPIRPDEEGDDDSDHSDRVCLRKRES